MKNLILRFLSQDYTRLSNLEMLHFVFPEGPGLVTCLWLVSTYVETVYNEVVKGKVMSIANCVAIVNKKYLVHTARRATSLLPLEFTIQGEGTGTRDGDVYRLAQNIVYSSEVQLGQSRFVQNLWVHNTQKKRR